MKGRRLILIAATMLGAVLGLSSAAHAVDPQFQNPTMPPTIQNLSCGSLDGLVVCAVDYTAEGILGTNHTIEWGNGVTIYPAGTNKSILSFRCFAGIINNKPFEVTVRVRNRLGLATLSRFVTCDGTPLLRGIGSIFCEGTETQQALLPGGNYFRCDTYWVNDGSPMTVRWVSYDGQRQPAVFTGDRQTYAVFDCNNPGGADLTFSAYVIVTDAAGSMTTPLTIPCGW